MQKGCAVRGRRAWPGGKAESRACPCQPPDVSFSGDGFPRRGLQPAAAEQPVEFGRISIACSPDRRKWSRPMAAVSLFVSADCMESRAAIPSKSAPSVDADSSVASIMKFPPGARRTLSWEKKCRTWPADGMAAIVESVESA